MKPKIHFHGTVTNAGSGSGDLDLSGISGLPDSLPVAFSANCGDSAETAGVVLRLTMASGGVLDYMIFPAAPIDKVYVGSIASIDQDVSGDVDVQLFWEDDRVTLN